MSKRLKERWVPTPNDTRQIADNAVLGVSLDSRERVEWVYTIMPDGRRFHSDHIPRSY